ncbi:MAG: trehalose monomycolate/heme transporter [Acidimicrobiaceae bacterium]|nr:trehalose monomycolate/heme transporter [Acidimicrobiaceae bacterium]
MFPVAFGLSMDYEVFLLSRINEEHDRTGDNVSSVAGAASWWAPVPVPVRRLYERFGFDGAGGELDLPAPVPAMTRGAP